METLRSIAEGMEHQKKFEWGGDCLPNCAKCRLVALLDEIEKMDLVKKWRIRAEECRYALEENLPSNLWLSRHETLDECADELEAWLGPSGSGVANRSRPA